MFSKEVFIYTGKELLWEYWEDYKDFADSDTDSGTTFEDFVPEIEKINGDKLYQTNSMLTYFEEVEE